MAKTFHILAHDPTKIGQIRIVITSPTGRVVEAAIEETESGFRVRFSPSEIGDYTIEIFLDDNPLTDLPFKVASVVDPNVRKCDRRGRTELIEEEFVSPTTLSPLDFHSADEDFSESAALVDNNQNQPRRDSVYVSCEPTGTNLAPERVRAFGDGLVRGFVDEPAMFYVDTRGAGRANIDLTVEGPSEVNFQCHDNGDGTCTVAYIPILAGTYFVNICFAQKHIPGSPFRVFIDHNCCFSPSTDDFQQASTSASSSNDVMLRSIGSAPSGKMVCALVIFYFLRVKNISSAYFMIMCIFYFSTAFMSFFIH